MYLVKQTDVYKREREVEFTNKETITFFLPEGEEQEYEKAANDWKMTVALEKVDKVKKDRHLLTGDLIIQYRNAIREGFSKQLDPYLVSEYDHPRNQNTINGIKGYIKRIGERYDEWRKSWGIEE